jgi:uncharacterized protein with PQ loop repeat
MSILSRPFWTRNSRKIHLTFSWFGGIALLIWGLSGITHPIMSWTGPEQAKFFPPRLSADLPNLKSPAEILNKAGISHAILARVSPSFDGAVLQVTESKDKPRRYFSLKTGEELANRDQEHALWLAQNYTGFSKDTPTKITFQTQFDDDYPWVSRLLPVWRIEFASPDKRRAYIYTELNALSAQHNENRYWLQAFFRQLHTWAWLNNFENVQLILISGFMIALLGMSMTGIAMIASFKRRPIADPTRRWHRRIAYLVWLPIFVFAASGFYRLLQSHLGDTARGLREGQAMSLQAALSAPDQVWANVASGAANAVSFIEGEKGLLIRVERPALEAAPEAGAGGEHAHHMPVSKEERFKGKSTRGEIVYYDAATGAVQNNNDEAMARHLAVRLGGAKPDEIISTQVITRFGDGYDFRNKRLPVWQVTLNDANGRTLFIDTGANLLVDQVTRAETWEAWVFTYLHKWSFLRPLGRGVQDGLIVGSLVLAIGSALFGFSMLLRRRKKPVV